MTYIGNTPARNQGIWTPNQVANRLKQRKWPPYLLAPTTWNPSDKGAGVTLSNGNLTASSTAAASQQATRGIYEFDTTQVGGLYWEITADDAGLALELGVATTAWTGAYNGSGLWAVRRTIGTDINKVGSGVDTASGFTATKSVGDVFQFALKGGNLHCGVNGTWIGSSDPEANTGALWTGITGTVYPAFCDHDTSNAATCTANFGQLPFAYTPPAGYRYGFGEY